MKKTGKIMVLVVVFLLSLTLSIACKKKDKTSESVGGSETVSITESISGTQNESKINSGKDSEKTSESKSTTESLVSSENDSTSDSESNESGNSDDSETSSTSEIATYTATFIADGVTVDTVTFTSEDSEIIEPEIPEKTGYVGHWEKYTLAKKDITINAVYDVIKYVIEYIDEMGVVNNNRTSYTIIDDTFSLKSLSKAGYAFDGWFDDSNTKVEEIKKGTFGQITLYGKWSVAEYSITYSNTKDVANNNPLGYTMQSDDIILEDLHLDGYVFNGWYTSYNSRKTTIPKGSFGNITLTAKWTAINYSIAYRDTKGVYNRNKISYNIATETFDLEPLEKIGYTFVGWFEGDKKFDAIEKGSMGNREFTAKWDLVKYTITYENTKNATNENPTDYTIESDGIAFKDIAADGYKFLGWYMGDNKNKTYGTLKGSHEDMVLTAKWSPVEYQIQYKDTKGAANGNKASYNTETETFDLEKIEKDGYVFNGWFDENDKKITQIERGSIGDKTLTAKWTPIQYAAAFYADGVKVGTVSFTVDDETIADIPSVPDKEYYTGKWEPYSIIADNIIVNAVYSPINYSISYANTKGAVNSNITSYNYESLEIHLKDISVNGYTFKGWYDGDKKVDSIPAKSHGEKVLVADWELDQYHITYVSEYEAFNNNVTEYTIESENISLVDLEADGYTFNGWYLDSNKITEIKKGTYGDLTLTAKWSTNSYNVSVSSNISGVYYSGGGSYKYKSSVTLTVHAYTGYVWNGWYNGATLLYKGMDYSFSMPAENVSYTARFTLCESHNTDRNCVCVECGKIVHDVTSTSNCYCSKCGDPHAVMSEKGYCMHGEYIYFGYYPQTIKSSSVTIKTSQPDDDGYYTGSDGRKYAKVVAEPYGTGYKFSTGDTINKGSSYYFKVQPIKWKMMTQEDGKVLLFCENIIDSKCFNSLISDRTFSGTTVYAHNWEYSDIRYWLNKEFYNCAFDKLSQKLIQSTYLDNKTTGATGYWGYISNDYASRQNNTTDKIFFLSSHEFRNIGYTYGFTNSNRAKQRSDFAMVKGGEMDESGQGYYWERSPAGHKSTNAMIVFKDGSLGPADTSSYTKEVTVKQGVVPAVWIKIA